MCSNFCGETWLIWSLVVPKSLMWTFCGKKKTSFKKIIESLDAENKLLRSVRVKVFNAN